MAYQPIEDYGLIGNMHTAALVGRNGSIDWFCFPYFDSPSVFGAILDDRIGGRFRIASIESSPSKQFYWPDTNVLITRFVSAGGVGEVCDFMPVGVDPSELGHRQLVRQVRVSRGSMAFQLECTPAFNYARDPHETALSAEGARFTSAHVELSLITHLPLFRSGEGVRAEFVLKEGETAVFVLGKICEECPSHLQLGVEELFLHTVRYWRSWLAKCNYVGRWREMVYRSALALKLLTFEPTGAIIAAPTCSLPEAIGAGRNWDYRYAWLRDAAFTLYGLLRIGFTEEATAFMGFLEARCHEIEADGSLQIVYGIDGRHDLTEETLGHLEGYRGSRPVRIGNDAYRQLQLDVYGELLDSIYLYNKYVTPISYDLWSQLRRLLEWLANNWDRPDEGIWEVRSGPQHFLYSKLMCWVAFDRGIRLAEKRSFPTDRKRWRELRDRIYEQIMTEGYDSERKTFVQAYGSSRVDASNLIMPLVFFLSPTDPRMQTTLAAINRSPSKGGLVSDSLVFRYDPATSSDGLNGSEGTFNPCSFWLAEAMARAEHFNPPGLDSARLIFERMLGYANHVGLYSEETGASGEALGNFPQGFTHLALISAAFNLDRSLGRR